MVFVLLVTAGRQAARTTYNIRRQRCQPYSRSGLIWMVTYTASSSYVQLLVQHFFVSLRAKRKKLMTESSEASKWLDEVAIHHVGHFLVTVCQSVCLSVFYASVCKKIRLANNNNNHDNPNGCRVRIFLFCFSSEKI